MALLAPKWITISGVTLHIGAERAQIPFAPLDAYPSKYSSIIQHFGGKEKGFSKFNGIEAREKKEEFY